MESVLDETTSEQYEMYGRVHFIPFFGRLDRIDTESGNDYWRGRLRRVQRRTVLKELSALRGFLGWCKERGYLDKVPTIESPPRRATGKPDALRRYKGEWVQLSIGEVESVLAHLPQRGRRGAAPRAFYTVMWETGLRPSTLWSLRAPEDYVRGRRTLRIRA